MGVTSVQNIDPDVVVAQVLSVVADFEVSAVKTGMLAQPATVEKVAELASEGLLPHLVVDPVLVSSTGHPLMDDGGVEAYRDALLGPRRGRDAEPARGRDAVRRRRATT